VLELITNPDKSAYIFIELAGVVEKAGPVCDISYTHEGNTNEVFFMAEAIEKVINVLTFPDDGINSSKHLDAEILKHLDISKDGKSFEELAIALARRQDFELNGPNYAAAMQLGVANEFNNARRGAHRAAKDARKNQATVNLMDRAAKAKYVERLAAVDLAKAQIDMEYTERLANLTALEEEALANAPPQSTEAWLAHLHDGLHLMSEYIISRVSVGGKCVACCFS